MRRLLTYFLAAIQQAVPELDLNILRLLKVPEQEMALNGIVEPLQRSVLNQLANTNEAIIPALVDYHTIQITTIETFAGQNKLVTEWKATKPVQFTAIFPK